MKITADISGQEGSVSDTNQSESSSVFQIVAIGKNRWKVETTLLPTEIGKDTIPRKLREIKKEISTRFGHSENLLKYRQLGRKEVLSDGRIHVEFDIERMPVPSGAPHLTLQSMVTDTGDEYTNMICLVDLFPLDKFEKSINVDVVARLIRDEGIDEDFVQWDTLENYIQRILETQIPIHNIEIARGKLPSRGKDAELEYTFPLQPERGLTEEYLKARKVKRGAILCTKKPPTTGDEPGFSLKGKELPPRRGWDVKLIAEKGTQLTADCTEVIAEIDGLVTAKRKEMPIFVPQGRKVVPVEIAFHVEPMLVLSGKHQKHLTTDEAVEVTGSLQKNSHVISRKEVHIRGNVNTGSQIEASSDITVSGNVQSGTLVSDGSITSGGEVNQSKVIAKEYVNLAGPVKNSTIQATDVDLGEVEGTDIQAGHRVTVGKIGTDPEGKSSQVNIGRKRFLQIKIADTQRFLHSATNNLNRLYKLFGQENLENLTPSERSRTLMRLLYERKQKREKPYSTSEVEALKQLLGSVSTLKRLKQEKQDEIQILKRQLEESDDSDQVFVVKEKVTAKTLVTIGDHRTELEPTDFGIYVTTDKQGISVQTLPKDLESIETLLDAFAPQQVDTEPEPAPDDSQIQEDTIEQDLVRTVTETATVHSQDTG
jgi:uncharacterized protein (DUF342 family)